MSEKDVEELELQLTLFDQLLKQMDDLYHQFAKHTGLSDTAFWIIYTIKDEEETYIQRDLCTMWSYSKQTVNSALKKLEEQKVIELIAVKGNKKDKRVILTPYGETIAKEKVLPINQLEKDAFNKLTKNERMQLVKLFQKYIKELSIVTVKLVKN